MTHSFGYYIHAINRIRSSFFLNFWTHSPLVQGVVNAMISLIFPLFSLFSHSALFCCFCYTLLHHQPTIHQFSSISLIAVTYRASQLRCVDRRDLIAYMKRIRHMMCTDTIETHSRQRASHDSTLPGFHM